MRFSILAAFLPFLVSCSADYLSNAVDVDKRLSASSIEHILSGNTLVGVPDEATPWAVYYHSDGTEYGNYGDDSDKGRWRVSDDMLCSEWSTWGDGERCFSLHQDESGDISGYSDGVKEWSATAKAGDSLGLAANE